MKVSRLCVATTLLVVGLGALLAGSVVAAVKVPDDLTGNWIGFFVSEADPPGERGEAALRVDFQERNRFTGKLALGRSSWEIAGAVDMFNNLHIVGVDPPEPDMPGAMILIRGTVRFTDPPQPDTDPPNPDAEPPSPDADPPSEIVADYLIVYSDGSMDMGYLELVPAVRPR